MTNAHVLQFTLNILIADSIDRMIVLKDIQPVNKTRLTHSVFCSRPTLLMDMHACLRRLRRAIKRTPNPTRSVVTTEPSWS